MFSKLFNKKNEKKIEEIKMPIEGQIINIEKVPDDVFSKKIMGEGVAVIPYGEILCSPIDGVIDQIFETKHAIIIKSKKGTNILIHVGMDTVTLEGQPFEVLISQGKKVKSGDPIMKVNFELIKEKGLSIITPVVIIDESQSKVIENIVYGNASKNETTIMTVK